ncbi:MAG: hypothetical protein HC865_08350 [Cyanobacteria bacterium RU_5_0]|nr:hypothetical protein [Cyanobacteria bacterium RU_5_0]
MLKRLADDFNDRKWYNNEPERSTNENHCPGDSATFGRRSIAQKSQNQDQRDNEGV